MEQLEELIKKYESSILACMFDVKLYIHKSGRLELIFPMELQSVVIRNATIIFGDLYRFSGVYTSDKNSMRQPAEFNLKIM